MASRKATQKALGPVLFIVLAMITSVLQARDQEQREKGAVFKGEISEETQYLPEGAGRTLLLDACLQCHDLRNIVSQRKTAAGWQRTIHEMIWRGAPLMVGEAGILANYLAASFGPDTPAANALRKSSQQGNEPGKAQYLPEGEGRDLTIQACGKCHGLQTVISRRKTLPGWRRTIVAMVRLGTPLMAAEAETIARYLADFFGPSNPAPQ